MERMGFVNCNAAGTVLRGGSSKVLDELGGLPQAKSCSYLSSAFSLPQDSKRKGRRLTHLPL